ncbi:putative reverse transcriptase domain-containing protein [Tanacetum coccineum]
MVPTRQSSSGNGANPNIAAIIAQQLQMIIPQIVTQVTNNVNNANANGGNGNGNGGNENGVIETQGTIGIKLEEGPFNVNAVDSLQDLNIVTVVDGKKVEVDRIICGCKLELGNFMFTIDLISLGHGSFDVIVGMYWLSEHKAEIVCHEKVVRIPLASGEVHWVQGERALESSNSLMSTKLDEQKLDDIPIA